MKTFIAYCVSQDVTIARWLSYKAYDGDQLLIFIRITEISRCNYE